MRLKARRTGEDTARRLPVRGQRRFRLTGIRRSGLVEPAHVVSRQPHESKAVLAGKFAAWASAFVTNVRR